MPRDTNAMLQASITTTTSFNSTGIDLGTCTPRTGMTASVVVTAVSGTDTSIAFKIQHSSDDINFTDLAFATNPAMTAVGETWIPFETDKEFVRLVATITGTTPIVTYYAGIVAGRP
jgi:hypothetical protein